MMNPIYTEAVSGLDHSMGQADGTGTRLCQSGWKTTNHRGGQNGSWSSQNPKVGITPSIPPFRSLSSRLLTYRRLFDFFTGYKDKPVPTEVFIDGAPSIEAVQKLRQQGILLSDKNWLLRIILLESIAGVPGMVGGTLRHLRSLRLLVSGHTRNTPEGRQADGSAEMGVGSTLCLRRLRMSACTCCEWTENPLARAKADAQDVHDDF